MKIHLLDVNTKMLSIYTNFRFMKIELSLA